MDVPGEAARLRIFIGENDSFGDRRLANALVLKARELGIAGATATPGTMGYGKPSHSDDRRLLLSHDLPIVVEVVDSHEMIDKYFHAIQPMIRSGLVTLDTIRVLRYGEATGQAGLC
jgi:PII-like signaling protein